MTKSTTTPLKLFQWLLINLTVTTVGLGSLPFYQMPAKSSLCSATEGKGELLTARQTHAMPPALGVLPHIAGRRACRGLAASWAWQEDTGMKRAPRNWVGTSGSTSLHVRPGVSSAALSSPLPLPQVSLRTRTAATAPLCLGIDYSSLSGLIH